MLTYIVGRTPACPDWKVALSLGERAKAELETGMEI
jgi:hypothetical protein